MLGFDPLLFLAHDALLRTNLAVKSSTRLEQLIVIKIARLELKLVVKIAGVELKLVVI